MGFTRRYDASSDVDETFEPSRRSRKRPRRTHSLPPSSPPPQSPGPLPDPTDEDHSGSDDDVATPPRAPLPNLLSTFQHPSHPSSSTAATPRPIPGPRSFLQAESLEPRPSSPMGDVPDETPIPTPLPSTSTRRGRPKYSPETQRLSKELSRLQRHKTSPSKRQYRDIWEKREARKESAREELQKAKKWEELERKKARKAKMVEKEREHKEAVKVAEAAETLRAQQLIELALKPQEEGGFGFEGLDSFFTAVFRKGGDAVISRKISQYVAAHGSEHAKSMFARSETARDEYFTDVLREKLKKEGRAIQKLLTRDETTTVQELLKQFSMEKLMDEIRDAAPTIWEALEIVSMPDHATRRPSAGETRRDKGLVFTTICALVAVLRSQKANNFQLVVGLFLLGSGAAKREISVLAHAGISISEGLGRIREVVASSMCQVVWDNLNIAFRIAEQRLNAKNHFGDDRRLAPFIAVGVGLCEPRFIRSAFQMLVEAASTLRWIPERFFGVPEIWQLELIVKSWMKLCETLTETKLKLGRPMVITGQINPGADLPDPVYVEATMPNGEIHKEPIPIEAIPEGHSYIDNNSRGFTLSHSALAGTDAVDYVIEFIHDLPGDITKAPAGKARG
ncbi:hypothetical protein HMN09_00206500 [Mycena chlorophos]|uniref:Uncharacterized protein n=1 Tax=Mycena chlorophos TaxID=658473 RepID=A0A8H6WL75_MYCCL|nr:hypothetical protein HMN09_00206500 [Mycena chlorophos]